jgi:predicted ATPase
MLQHLCLTSFKSFRRAEAPMGPLTLIVGTNASGKSNVREALRVLHGVGLGFSLADILGEKYGPGGILQWRGIRGGSGEAGFEGAKRLGITVRVLGPAQDALFASATWTYALEVELGGATPGPRVITESLYTEDALVFDSDPANDPLAHKHDELLRVRYARGGSYKRHGKVVALGSSTPALSQLAEKEKEPPFVRRACTHMLDVFASIRFLDLDPDAMRQPSQPGQTILGDRGENLSSVLLEICRDEQRESLLLEWLRALTPMDATDFVFRTDLTGRVLVYLKESNGFEVSAYSASDGTLRFLALIAALLSADSGRIYFFEELDNGIHPTRLHLLLDLIQRASQTMKVQVIGTTHNPALLAYLDKNARRDALLVYRGDSDRGSRILRIHDLPDAERVLASQDLGRLHQAGWLEDAAAFGASEDEEGNDGD